MSIFPDLAESYIVWNYGWLVSLDILIGLGPTGFARLLDLFSNEEWLAKLRNFATLNISHCVYSQWWPLAWEMYPFPHNWLISLKWEPISWSPCLVINIPQPVWHYMCLKWNWNINLLSPIMVLEYMSYIYMMLMVRYQGPVPSHYLREWLTVNDWQYTITREWVN